MCLRRRGRGLGLLVSCRRRRLSIDIEDRIFKMDTPFCTDFLTDPRHLLRKLTELVDLENTGLDTKSKRGGEERRTIVLITSFS
jgi:hypothetical protein